MELALLVYVLGIIASISSGLMMVMMAEDDSFRYDDDLEKRVKVVDPLRRRGSRILLCAFIWPVSTLPMFLVSLWQWADINIEMRRKGQ